MALFWGIFTSYLALIVGVIIRFIQDDKDGVRDGFDDSVGVK